MNKKRIKVYALWGIILMVILFTVPLIALTHENPDAMALSLLPIVVGYTFGFSRMKIFDWTRIKEYGSIEEIKKDLLECFNDFIKELNEKPLKQKALSGQKFTGPDANLQGTAPVVLVQADRETPDRGYERIFDPVNMRQATSRTFDILDITGGITYYQTEDGQPAKLSRVPKGTKTPVSMLRFTGGFSVLDDWLRFNEYYRIDRLGQQAVRDWYKQRATLLYALITALTGIDQAFDTNDETTINNAAANILNDLNALGYDLGDGSEFVIVANPMLRSRLRKALATTYETPITGSTAKQGADKVDYTISALITTPKITNTSNYWVCLPGEKSLLGDWEDLNARPAQRNELVLGADHVSTGAYNAIIGEKKQFKKCALV